jgi:lipopolysaccharide biosynthesis protein
MFNWLFKSKNSNEKGSKNTNKDNSLICIYAAYNVDDDDMKFINDNCNDCTFIVIDSLNRPYLNGSRLKNNNNIEYITRNNIGYDVTAWKDYIVKNYDKLKKYDYVALVNNSCRYDFKIRSALDDMIKKNATFYGLNISPVHNDHIQSYFTIIHKDIIKKPGFINHWALMKEITGRDDAIINHELTFMKDMVNIGANAKTLTTYDFIGSGYEPERYNLEMGVIPPFMKKKLLKEPGMRNTYERLLRRLPHML